LEALIREATRWQELRISSLGWGTIALRKREPDRWVEVVNLFGSTGESALLAASATVEIELLRQGIRAGTVPYEYAISQRFFAEAQGQQVMGTAHRLANVVARILMIDPDYPWGSTGVGDIADRFPPESDDRKHWISLTDSKRLVRAGRMSRTPFLKRMSASVNDMRKRKEWRNLDDQRGADFHRARRESPYFARMEYRSEPGMKGITVFGSPRPTDPAAHSAVERICTTSRSGLDLLLPVMKVVRRGWVTAAAKMS
jgi:hypothetical protein